MARETLTLRMRDGTSCEASAQVSRREAGARAGRAGGIAVGGVLIGALTILVPGVHLIGPWLIPLFGFGIAWYIYKIRAKISQLEISACPSCGASNKLDEGGVLDGDPLWIRCPSCRTPLEVRLHEAAH